MSFTFEGSVKTQGNLKVNLSVISYNEKKEIINLTYAKEGVKDSTSWVRVNKRFTIPEGVKYIRFRLTGDGIGKAWFDDIVLKKEEQPNQLVLLIFQKEST
ncbi:MAG: hypothetical protein V1872_13260 [bacterium]